MDNLIFFLYRISTEGHHKFDFIHRICANILVYLLPICRYNCESEITKESIIISLTTFPKRINNLWKVIETLMHQNSEKKICIELWLSKEEFKDGKIPFKLKKLERKGLNIIFVNGNLKPHKKYYYAFQKHPENIIITVDDDVLYPLSIVHTLVQAQKDVPHCICCNRGRMMSRNVKGEVENYSKWKLLSLSTKRTISPDILPTGIGGVLYPPHSYDLSIFDEPAIKSTCLLGDDLWLNFMCRLNGFSVVHTCNKINLYSIISSQKQALFKTNIEFGNTEQIKKISDWANIKFGVDFFLRKRVV